MLFFSSDIFFSRLEFQLYLSLRLNGSPNNNLWIKSQDTYFLGTSESIYKFGLSVCLYPKNVKTSNFFVGYLGTPGKVYEWSKFQILVSIKIRSSLNFWKFLKSTKFFVKIHELFLFCFTMYTRRTCSQLI